MTIIIVAIITTTMTIISIIILIKTPSPTLSSIPSETSLSSSLLSKQGRDRQLHHRHHRMWAARICFQRFDACIFGVGNSRALVVAVSSRRTQLCQHSSGQDGQKGLKGERRNCLREAPHCRLAKYVDTRTHRSVKLRPHLALLSTPPGHAKGAVAERRREPGLLERGLVGIGRSLEIVHCVRQKSKRSGVLSWLVLFGF